MQTGDFLLPAQQRRRGARTNKAPDVVHDPDSDTTCPEPNSPRPLD
jgi:hypothetical protein